MIIILSLMYAAVYIKVLLLSRVMVAAWVNDTIAVV